MKNSIEQSEKIDAYLTGKMSDAEKKEFERLLSDPETSLEDRTKLQDEMELRKEIIFAVRKRGFREHVAKELAKIKEEEEEAHKIAAARIKLVVLYTIRATASIAVAACFVGVFIAPQLLRLNNLSNQGELYAEALIEMTDAYTQLKGSDDAANVILEATALMQSGDNKQADALLADALQAMPKVTKADGQAWTEKGDMLYLRALCAIKQHKLYRSRRLLNEVVRMDGLHRDQAAELLHTIKHGQ